MTHLALGHARLLFILVAYRFGEPTKLVGLRFTEQTVIKPEELKQTSLLTVDGD